VNTVAQAAVAQEGAHPSQVPELANVSTPSLNFHALTM
jgi:hypothetical protein